MSIKIDFTPIHAVGELATRAGIAEADAQSIQSRNQAMLMKMQHDYAMKEAEMHAQLQSDAQYRENMFNLAVNGQQFQQNRLTLEEQYGYNIKLARAKADVDLQAEVADYQMKKKRLDAYSDSVRQSKILTDVQKESVITSLESELLTGRAMPSNILTPRLSYKIENVGGVPMNVSYDTYGNKQILGEAGKVQPEDAVAEYISQTLKNAGHPSITKSTGRSIGDIISKGGKQWKIVAFDADGEPLVEDVK